MKVSIIHYISCVSFVYPLFGLSKLLSLKLLSDPLCFVCYLLQSRYSGFFRVSRAAAAAPPPPLPEMLL